MHIPENSVLFNNISPNQVHTLLSCLDTKEKKYAKGEIIIREGDVVDTIGFVFAGSVQVFRLEYAGNRIIQAIFGPGSVFAETFVCAGVKSPVTVAAAEDSRVLFIPFYRMLKSCGESCTFHTQLIHNMIELLAKKNLLLNAKIELSSKRTIRDKLLLFLSEEQKKVNTKKFSIPFNRYELADFLCVDRSALSRELSRMKKEGLISFEKNEFELLTKSFY